MTEKKTPSGAESAPAACSETDILDLMRDEFLRIVSITSESEIKGLCERAISRIVRTVPIIEECQQLHRRVAVLSAAAERAKELWFRWPKVSANDMQEMKAQITAALSPN